MIAPSMIKEQMICRMNASTSQMMHDLLVVEEPLEIAVRYSSATGQLKKVIAITMRTPGHDLELAIGFLFTEGIIRLEDAMNCSVKISPDSNSLLVELPIGVLPVLQHAERNFYSSSSCGICGKVSIEATRSVSAFEHISDSVTIQKSIVYKLNELLRLKQVHFQQTGGIHGCGLFDVVGNCILVREDVGRHNALDKLIGAAIKELPLTHSVLMLSGRISFELVQKAAMAGLKIIAAVGAPSTLAVELAEDYGMTLIGFLKADRFNIYCGKERIIS